MVDGPSADMFTSIWHQNLVGEDASGVKPLFLLNFDNRFETCLPDAEFDKIMAKLDWQRSSSYLFEKISFAVFNRQAANLHKGKRFCITFAKAEVDAIKLAVVARMKETKHKDGWISESDALCAYLTAQMMDAFDVPMKFRKNQMSCQQIDVRAHCDSFPKPPEFYFGSCAQMYVSFCTQLE